MQLLHVVYLKTVKCAQGPLVLVSAVSIHKCIVSLHSGLFCIFSRMQCLPHVNVSFKISWDPWGSGDEI